MFKPSIHSASDFERDERLIRISVPEYVAGLVLDETIIQRSRDKSELARMYARRAASQYVQVLEPLLYEMLAKEFNRNEGAR